MRVEPSNLPRMKTIPIATVDRIWDHVNQASEAQTLGLAQRFQEQQPALMIYLLASEEAIESGEEPGWLLSLGGIVFEIMTSEKPGLPMVPPEQIDEAEAANVAFLEKLEEGSEMDWMTAVQKTMAMYNQWPLLGAVIEALMEGQEESPELASDAVGTALLALKTVIDCLDAHPGGGFTT
jgi:hypothetical protein